VRRFSGAPDRYVTLYLSRRSGDSRLAGSREWARLYCNVSLIDCDTCDVLDDLLANTPLGRFVVERLSDRAVIVDAQHKALVARALNRRGQLFRIVDLPSRSPSTMAGSNAR
jgi:hypothetical protein